MPRRVDAPDAVRPDLARLLTLLAQEAIGQPSPVSALVSTIGTPIATGSTFATSGSGSGQRSALLSTITGSAPLSQAVVR